MARARSMSADPLAGRGRMMVILFEILFVSITTAFGGPSWTIASLLSFVLGASHVNAPHASIRRWLILTGLSLAWLAASKATHNRELFFPFSMHLAACAWIAVASHGWWVGLAAATAQTTVFLLIRAAEAATPTVLSFEAVVAAAVIACGGLVQRKGSGHRDMTASHRPIDRLRDPLTVGIMAGLAALGLRF